MSDDKREKKNRLEVSSQPLQDELVAIKDRISAIEIIQSVSNADHVRKYAEEFLKTENAKSIMIACREPQTKEQIRVACGYNSKPALDYHLQPLKEANLLRHEVREGGMFMFDWSYLFRSLPKATIRSLLGENKQQREKRPRA